MKDSMACFDHLVIGIRSLDEGIEQFEKLTGVRPAVGGQHPGRGTENALVSLGPGAYLEILAPQPGVQLSDADARLSGLDRLTIVTWAVAVEDAIAAATALNAAGFGTTPAKRGSRVTPAGARLEWTVFKLAAGATSMAPFFIQWSESTRHPSGTAPEGCVLERLAVREPEPGRLRVVLDALGVTGVTVEGGKARIEAAEARIEAPETRIEAGIRCAARRAVLTTAR
jgi:hypothetical protein